MAAQTHMSLRDSILLELYAMNLSTDMIVKTMALYDEQQPLGYPRLQAFEKTQKKQDKPFEPVRIRKSQKHRHHI